MPSARSILMATIKETAQTIRNGRYFVKRGAIAWSAHDFKEHPHNIAIMVDEQTLVRDEVGLLNATMTLEMFSRMPSPVPDNPEIDDDLQEELVEDATEILRQIRKAQSGDEPVVLKLVGKLAGAVEAHDASRQVQGLVVTFNVGY